MSSDIRSRFQNDFRSHFYSSAECSHMRYWHSLLLLNPMQKRLHGIQGRAGKCAVLHNSMAISHVAPPRASGRFSGMFLLHICEGIQRAGAACLCSSFTECLKMKVPTTMVPKIANAVLRRQCFGSAYQPPAGDHTPCAKCAAVSVMAEIHKSRNGKVSLLNEKSFPDA